MACTKSESDDIVQPIRRKTRIDSSYLAMLSAVESMRTLPSNVNRKRKREDEEEAITTPWTKMIKVVVGKDETPFLVHEKVIRQVPFFRACLDGPMRESQERVVDLPEDSATAFADLVHYIYHNELETSLVSARDRIAAGDKSLQTSRLSRKAIRLYYLAKKLLLEGLQNVVMDDMVRYMKTKCFAAWEIVLIEEHAESDDKLRQFALLNVANYIHTWGGWEGFEGKNQIKYKEPEYQTAACFMVEALVKYSKENLPKTAGVRCQWHVHTST